MDFERGNQLKGYIQREIKEQPMHSNYGYNYYFCRNFLERLFGEVDKSPFVLRGSFSQLTTLGKYTRPLTDIDIITYDHLKSSTKQIEQILGKKYPIKYQIKQQFVTTNSTINYRILCSFDNIQHLITMDLHKDIIDERTRKEMPIVFSKDRVFDVNTSTLEEHLANKFYVAFMNLQLNQELGKVFRRFKDFYDIYAILSLGNVDEKRVMELLKERIVHDDFLHSYELKDNLFDQQFVSQNLANWEVERQKYEFKKEVDFQDATKMANEFIEKHR